MHDLKAYAVRKTGVIEVSISGMLPDSCHEAVVEDKYPGGKRVYVRDPGVAQVFIKERKRPNAVYPMIYRRVYGPASKEECSAWLARNCAKHPNVS